MEGRLAPKGDLMQNRVISFIVLALVAGTLLAGVNQKHFDKAQLHESKGEFNAALSEYHKVLEQAPKNIAAMCAIAQIYRWTRRFTLAETWWRRILTIEPRHAEARLELSGLRLQRGLHFSGGFGGWEIDYTKKSMDFEVFTGVIDRADLYAGYSNYDRFYYNREKVFGKVYWYLKPDMFLKLELNYKNYGYPAENNPDPDDMSYDKVPSIEIELNRQLNRMFQVSLYVEGFRPSFYWDQTARASNIKLGGQVNALFFKLLTAKLFLALLRDPNPETFSLDKAAGRILNLEYRWQSLVGGGLEFAREPFSAGVKFIPNRDLDNSLKNSIFINLGYTLRAAFIPFPVEIRVDYVLDNYSAYSYLSGQSTSVIMATFQAEPLPFLGLRPGFKVLHGGLQPGFGAFLNVTCKLKLQP
jgi:tetratricopeptide (TPR) repeat protein